MMLYRPLGKTGLQVTPISLGCGQFPQLPMEHGVRIVQRAVELGMNYVDVARSYGDAEVKVGRALQGQREKVYISTKTGARTRDEAWKSIHESLERLQTDYVDNCHLHGIHEGEDMDRRLGPGGALEALIEAREQGLVRHIGCTSHISRALIVALQRFDFEVILVPMNIVEREPLSELIPLCQQKGVGVTIMKPVATGLLPARLALKWLMHQPVATAVPGVTTIDELELDVPLNVMDDISLTAEEQAQVETLTERLEHVRCRICGACEPCPQGIGIRWVLGTDVMYDHYRTMGHEAFAAFPWTMEAMDRDLHAKEQLAARIESCDHCGECAAKCPHGLPTVEMLQHMLPALRDMIGIYQQRLRNGSAL